MIAFLGLEAFFQERWPPFDASSPHPEKNEDYHLHVAFLCTKRSGHELGSGRRAMHMLLYLGFWRAGVLGVWGVSGALAIFSGPRPSGRHAKPISGEK